MQVKTGMPLNLGAAIPHEEDYASTKDEDDLEFVDSDNEGYDGFVWQMVAGEFRVAKMVMLILG